MNLDDLMRVLRRRRAMLAVLTLLGAVVGGVLNITRPVEYQSTAEVFVAARSDSSVTDLSQANTLAQSVVSGYERLVTTPLVLNGVIADLKLDMSAADLADQVSAASVTATPALDITVTDGSAARAARIANSIADNLSASVAKVTPTGSASSIQITLVQPATAAAQPVNRSVVLDGVLGGFLGLIVAVGVALLLQLLDRRVQSADDVRRSIERPVLGTIPFDECVAAIAPTDQTLTGSVAEAYRVLRTNLRFLTQDTEHGLVVTSSIAGEGKTASAAMLAMVVAESGQRVAIVDADLRRPSLAHRFGLPDDLGLTDVLVGAADLDDALLQLPGRSVFVLPAGTIPPNPSELIQSTAMSDLVLELAMRFDFVIYDAAPLLPVTDAVVLAKQTSGALVVAAARQVQRDDLAAALHNLEQANAEVLGLVVTKTRERTAPQYSYETRQPAVSVTLPRAQRPQAKQREHQQA